MPQKDLIISQPNLANALTQAEGINRSRDNALRRDRYLDIAEGRDAADKEAFEFGKMQKMLGYALNFLPSMDHEEWGKAYEWLGEIGAPVKFLRKDVPPEEWPEYRDKVVLGAQGIVNSTKADYEAKLAKDQEALEHQNALAEAKEKSRLARLEEDKKQKNKESLEEKKARLALEGKDLITWVTPSGKSINLRPGVKPPEGSVKKEKSSSSTEYEKDQAKMIDDTRGYYSILMKTLLDDVGDVKAGKEEEYNQLTSSFQEDLALIGEGSRPKWLERKKPVAKPKPVAKKLTKEIAADFMDQAENNIEEARRLAKEAGYTF